jgi:Ca2+/Na+ antiporter
MIGTVLLSIGILILIGFKVGNSINSNVQASDSFTTEGKSAANQLTGYYSSSLDNAFLLLTMGLCIVSLIMAALVRVHPIFLVLFIIAFIFVIYFSAVLSNIYSEMASNSQLSTEADKLIFVSLILGKLPLFIGIFGILLMIVMYKVWSYQ